MPGEAALQVSVAVARTGAPELRLQQAELLALKPALHPAHHLQHPLHNPLPQVNIAEAANLLLLALQQPARHPLVDPSFLAGRGPQADFLEVGSAGGGAVDRYGRPLRRVGVQPVAGGRIVVNQEGGTVLAGPAPAAVIINARTRRKSCRLQAVVNFLPNLPVVAFRGDGGPSGGVERAPPGRRQVHSHLLLKRLRSVTELGCNTSPR